MWGSKLDSAGSGWGPVGNPCDTVANIEKQTTCEKKEAFLSAQETLRSTIMNRKTI